MDLQITAARLTGDTERDVKSLANHVFQLEEQLRYQLRNMDVTNFNDLGLARYEKGRLQIYTKAVEVQTKALRVEFGKETDEIYAQISATAEELLAEIEDVEGNYTSLKATVDGLTTRVGDTEQNYSSISQTVSQIQTTVSGHTSAINSHGSSISSLQSKITQTNSKISAVVSAVDDSSGNVTAASIVAAINEAGSSVQISANNIQLYGYVTVSDLAGNGAVQINGGNITAGTINGASFYSQGSAISGDPLASSYVHISGGYVEFTGGMIMYSLNQILWIVNPMTYGAIVLQVGGVNWEFTSSNLYKDGVAVL